MIEFSPAVSGDGSVLVKPLTPTTICSPRSIASRRRVLDSTSLAFSAPVSIALTAPPIASMAAISASASVLSLRDQRRDFLAAVEDVAELQKVRLVGHDLLQAQRPLLVERARQAERLVPGRQLDGAGARVLRQHHRQHLDQDAIGVVLRLLLGEAERVDLHAVAETALGRVLHAEAVAGDLVPQLDERAHLGEFGDEAHAGVDEERHAARPRWRSPSRRPRPTGERARARRWRWRARRQAPAPASPPPPADGRSRRSSGSTSAPRGRRTGSGPWSAAARRRAERHRTRAPDIP